METFGNSSEDMDEAQILREELLGELVALAEPHTKEEESYKGIAPMFVFYADDIDRMEDMLESTIQTLKNLSKEDSTQHALALEKNNAAKHFVDTALETLARFEKTLDPFSAYLRSTGILLEKGMPLRHKELQEYVENAIEFLTEYLKKLEDQHERGQELLRHSILAAESPFIYAIIKFLTEALQAHPGSHSRSANALKGKLESVAGLIKHSFQPEETSVEEIPVDLDPMLAALS